jgi:arsenate reductase
MSEEGYDISAQYPKLVDDFIDETFDYVLTVCDSANELCPIFPNAKNRIHNSFVDPSRASYDSDEHALQIYKQTVKEISDWIDNLNPNY